ncbi:CshA/CshB family fibrillar adhesin-related protein [Spirosoma sp. KNUC1025]|uniref:CshA/CshB family fibrillar adhesin-related protein n=1 Tax=Spirosoma sp. KNUC1025 TaxID=2894082 RepID=UPI0038679CD8|nr:CshA/CshB family fibrillar adhesin-related protein [Spirosoma sp. KNUC1025]
MVFSSTDRRDRLFKRLLFASLGLLFSYQSWSQAVKATGGSGQYKNDIYWLTFSDLNDGIAAGGSVTRSFQVGLITVHIDIDNISFSGEVFNGSLSQVRLVGYRPGAWFADGMDDMYNIGGAGVSNTLTNGLSVNTQGASGVGGELLEARFRIRAYATLNGLPTDLALLLANAESDDGQEYEQISTNGSAWQLLEKRLNDPNQEQSIQFSTNNNVARMQIGGGNVGLLYTNRENTTSTDPLSSDVVLLCGGNTAIALGVMVSSDSGDNPGSYGSALNIFQPAVSGGNPSAGSGSFTNYLSSGGLAGGTPVIEGGSKINPTTLRIGAQAADEDLTGFNTSLANGDDIDNTDDEDGFASSPPSVTLTASSYSVNLPVFKNTVDASATRYVMAWIDFNRNGSFEPAEYATTSFTANNTLTNLALNWSLASMPKTSGSSYARFRITSVNPSSLIDDAGTGTDERSIMALPLGETEDYTINLAAPDLTPIIYARATTVYNTTNISVVVDNYELNGQSSSGLITVKVTKDPKIRLSLNTTATLVGGRPVQNNVWSLDADSDTDYYVLTSNSSVTAGGVLSFGMSGVLTPGATSGTLTMTATISEGSGGEAKISNNIDADKIDFFQQ